MANALRFWSAPVLWRFVQGSKLTRPRPNSRTANNRKAVEDYRSPRRFATIGAGGSPPGFGVRQSSSPGALLSCSCCFRCLNAVRVDSVSKNMLRASKTLANDRLLTTLTRRNVARTNLGRTARAIAVAIALAGAVSGTLPAGAADPARPEPAAAITITAWSGAGSRSPLRSTLNPVRPSTFRCWASTKRPRASMAGSSRDRMASLRSRSDRGVPRRFYGINLCFGAHYVSQDGSGPARRAPRAARLQRPAHSPLRTAT